MNNNNNQKNPKKYTKNKIKERIKDDFRSVSIVEEGSILKAFQRLSKKLFK